MIDVHIVLVNYFMAPDIIRAVESILSDLSGSSYTYALTVVDNSGNRDNLAALLKPFGTVRLIDAGQNIGFGRANTLGFVSERARYYLALNPDTNIPPRTKAIDRLISFMDKHPRVGCVGPKLVYPDGRLQYTTPRFDVRSILIKPLKHIKLDQKYRFLRRYADRLVMKDFDHEKTQPVDWVLGAAMMVRHEVTEQVGWFDPRYFMYFEDTDWCRSMWHHGWPVYYYPDVVIEHRYSRDSARVRGAIKAIFTNPLSRAHAKSWCMYLWKWRKEFRHHATNIK
jgi:GT2 family glycosyltransferase